MKGDLTRGMSVVDDRKGPAVAPPNVHLAVGAAVGEVRQWVERVLKQAP